jgi:hypothetical protein
VIGDGAIGARDGSFAEAEFNHPQGMALDGDLLYICRHGEPPHPPGRSEVTDGRNAGRHRSAGTPVQPARYRNQRRSQLSVGSARPRWKPLRRHGRTSSALGRRSEDTSGAALRRQRGARITSMVHSNRRHSHSRAASPPTVSRSSLPIARSAQSVLPLSPGGTVTTIVGKGLFDFGDTDGVGDIVRLQHPLGVAYAGWQTLRRGHLQPQDQSPRYPGA